MAPAMLTPIAENLSVLLTSSITARLNAAPDALYSMATGLPNSNPESSTFNTASSSAVFISIRYIA